MKQRDPKSLVYITEYEKVRLGWIPRYFTKMMTRAHSRAHSSYEFTLYMIFEKFHDNIHYNLNDQFQKNHRNGMSNFARKIFCTNLVLSHGTWMLIKTKRNYPNFYHSYYHMTCCSSKLLPQVITRLNLDFKKFFLWLAITFSTY